MNTDQIAKAKQIAEQQAWHSFRVQMDFLTQEGMRAAAQSHPTAPAEWRAGIEPLFQELARQLAAVAAAAAATATCAPREQS